MKQRLFFCISLALLSSQAGATPLNGTDGIDFSNDREFGSNYYDTGNPLQESLDLWSETGALELFSLVPETSRGSRDGGIGLLGNPIRLILGSGTGTGQTGNFEIWKGSDAGASFNFPGSPSPLFAVNGTSGQVTASGNLAVTGTITSAGSTALTQASAPTFLKGASKLEIGSTASAGSTSVAFGTNTQASGTTSIAAGNLAIASGLTSVALGQNAKATGIYSVALGGDGIADASYSMAGQQSWAHGVGSTALSSGFTQGASSFAAGPGTCAYAFGSVCLGLFPTNVTGTADVADKPADAVLVVGNGTGWTSPDIRSNAIVTLKSGQTTLKNRFWNSAAPVANVTTTDAAAGNALVVEGNTVLKGKVIISTPQGDLSPGIYTN